MQNKKLIKVFETDIGIRMSIYDIGNNKISLEFVFEESDYKAEFPREISCFIKNPCVIKDFKFVVDREENEKCKIIEFYEMNISIRVFETDKSHNRRLLQIIDKMKRYAK